jgi:shikimate kinase
VTEPASSSSVPWARAKRPWAATWPGYSTCPSTTASRDRAPHRCRHPFIFEKEGEAGFRQREREAIEALTALEGIVLATGGGAVLLPENRERLATRGRVVYLQTSVAQQAHRVRYGRHRPLLAAGDDAAARLGQLMDARAPLYAQIADITVSTDGRRVHSVAESILRELGVAQP